MADILRNVANRIGIAEGQDLYDDNYDFDEMNLEIAKMFMRENTKPSDDEGER